MNEGQKQEETIEIVGIVPRTRHELFAKEESEGAIYLLEDEDGGRLLKLTPP